MNGMTCSDIQEHREIDYLTNTTRIALQPVVRTAPALACSETSSSKATPKKPHKAPTRVVQSRSAAAGEGSSKGKAYSTLDSAINQYDKGRGSGSTKRDWSAM